MTPMPQELGPDEEREAPLPEETMCTERVLLEDGRLLLLFSWERSDD